MKTNQNDHGYESNTRNWSIRKSLNDSNVPEPDMINVWQSWCDEEDEISDFSRMRNAHDHDCDDNENIS
jgi:hypothetical protein